MTRASRASGAPSTAPIPGPARADGRYPFVGISVGVGQSRDRCPALLRRAARSRHLRHDADPARRLRRLLPRADRAAAGESSGAGGGRHQRPRHPAALRRRGQHRRPDRGAGPRAADAIPRCPICGASTTASPTAPRGRSRASRRRWRCSRPSASTIRCSGSRTTRRPRRATSSASCCSPTTSAMSTSSASWRKAEMEEGTEYDPFVEPGDVHLPNRAPERRRHRRHAAASTCRRCRPITWSAATARASR